MAATRSLAVVLLGAALLLACVCASPLPLHRRQEAQLGANEVLAKCLTTQGIEFVDSVRNTTSAYWDASQSDNVRFHFHPVAIAYPLGAKQVSKAVQCAFNSGNIQVAARSGGHSFAGFGSGGQDGALVVDMRELDKVASDAAHELAHIGPAARLGDVVKGLWADGRRAMPHGTCPTVGTGGHALCGGFGPTSRRWGMATDVILEAEVVLADGSIVHASQHENEELFWALRGSGSFFGIVTQFTFRTFDASSPMTFLEYRWTNALKGVDDAVKLAEGAQAFATQGSMPSELGWHFQLQQRNEGDPPGGVVAMHLRGMYAGSKAKYLRDVIPPLWNELKKRGAASRPDAVVEREMTYLEMMEEWDDFGKEGDKLDTLAERLLRNNFLARTSLSMGQQGFSAQGFRDIFSLLWKRAVDDEEGRVSKAPGEYFAWNIYFEMFGGTNARHRDADLVRSSSMVHRDGLWLIQASVGTYVDGPMSHEAHQYIQQIDSTIIGAFARDKLERKSYSCYADITLEDWKGLYYGTALPRLVALKKRIDPTNLFRNPQSLIETPPPTSVTGLLSQQGYANVHPLP